MHCLPLIKKTKRDFRLNSMLRITYRLPNITRRPKRAMTLTQTFCLSIPTILLSTTPFIFSLLLCTRTLTLIVVDSSSFKTEEFIHKMAISLKNCQVKQQNHSLLANCTNSALSSDNFVSLFDTLSVPLSLGSTVPFGRPSASFGNSFILSLCLTITTTSQSDPVQTTTPEGVLSQCWCRERSGQSRSSQGYMACCGCHEISIALCYPQEVFCRDQEKSRINRSCLCRLEEELSEITVKQELKTKKLNSDD